MSSLLADIMEEGSKELLRCSEKIWRSPACLPPQVVKEDDDDAEDDEDDDEVVAMHEEEDE